MRERTIRIVTDSAAQLPSDWAAENQVVVLPHTVTIDGKTYREGVDLTDDALSELVAHARGSVQVNAPSVADFIEVYQKLAAEKADVISLHVSAALSETIRNATQAQAEFRGRCNIQIIDSGCISLGLNGLVRSALKLSQQYRNIDESVKAVRGLLPHVYGLMVSTDLHHLERSKRLRPAQAELGKMLGVIPCLSLEEGDIVAVEKVRSPERAIERLSEFASEFDEFEQMAVLQLTMQPNEQCQLLIESLEPIFTQLSSIAVWPCGPIIGNIIGPSGFGVMIYEGDRG